MKQKKMLAISLVLVLLASLFVIAPASAVTQQVSLIYAKPFAQGLYIGAEGFVEVENLGADKSVTIHYSVDGKNWLDSKAEYFGTTHDNYEAWKFQTGTFEIGTRGSATIYFTVKYEVNGQTYWDNNNGANYKIKGGHGISSEFDFGSGGIAYWIQSQGEENVTVYTQLKNLAYEKDVRVRYSTDNWETYQEASGYYVSSFDNNSKEVWIIDVPTLEPFEYAISYTVNGTAYWDNNFGENYTFTPAT